jgi:hypothetical protein
MHTDMAALLGESSVIRRLDALIWDVESSRDHWREVAAAAAAAGSGGDGAVYDPE